MRLLIEHVYADVDEPTDEVVLWIMWVGGHHTQLRVPRRHRRTRPKDLDLSSMINTLRKILDDEAIGLALNRCGIRTARGATWTKKRVSQFRQHAKFVAFDAETKEKSGWLSQQEAATQLEISPMSANRLIQRGILPVEGNSPLPQVILRTDLNTKEVAQVVEHIKSHGNSPLPENPDQLSIFQTTTCV